MMKFKTFKLFGAKFSYLYIPADLKKSWLPSVVIKRDKTKPLKELCMKKVAKK